MTRYPHMESLYFSKFRKISLMYYKKLHRLFRCGCMFALFSLIKVLILTSSWIGKRRPFSHNGGSYARMSRIYRWNFDLYGAYITAIPSSLATLTVSPVNKGWKFTFDQSLGAFPSIIYAKLSLNGGWNYACLSLGDIGFYDLYNCHPFPSFCRLLAWQRLQLSKALAQMTNDGYRCTDTRRMTASTTDSR